MIGDQEARTKRSYDLYLVTRTQVTHIVGGHAAHRPALVVREHALDRQCQIVVTGSLAIAWAGDRVLACMMGTPLIVHARRNDANRLPLQKRKRHGTEVQYNVVRVVVLPDLGHANIAGYRGGDELFCSLRAVQVGVGVRSRPWRYGGSEVRCAGFHTCTRRIDHHRRCR